MTVPAPTSTHGEAPPAGNRQETALRHPKKPLVLLPHRLTEVTGPLLGDGLLEFDIRMQGGQETVFFDL
jgi:hypothetical protein